MLILSDYRSGSEEWACGKTVLRILCDYWNRPLPRQIAELSNPVSGMSPDVLAAAFRSLDFKVLEGSWTIDLLRAATKSGLPVAALTQMDGTGHWVAVSGVSRGKIHFNCPEVGPTSQRIKDWENSWIDFHYLSGTYDRWAICPQM